MKAATPEAYQLLHDGILALSAVEEAGMRIDLTKLNDTIEMVSDQIEELESEMKKDSVYKTWKRRFGEKTNLGARDQLAAVLFAPESKGGLGLKGGKMTTSGKRYSVEESQLSRLGDELAFVKLWLHAQKLKDCRSKNLIGIRNRVQGDLLHPIFNLHTAVTYRGSAEDPNSQNFPARDEELAKLVRSCFISRGKDYRIAEADYGRIEVHGAAWYNHDPVLLAYLHDPTKDMHRDMSMECFILTEKEMKDNKAVRAHVKNKFVFPQFYGSDYINVAQDLWHAVQSFGLTTSEASGSVPLFEHLAKHGITKMGACSRDRRPRSGTFEAHIQAVEKDFWGRRFRVYSKWKDSWYAGYRSRGWIETLDGFIIEGLFGRNDIINYGIQGVAFHCLLWSLTRIQRIMTKRRMRSRIIGQIHDSIVGDIHKKETDDYYELVVRVMTKDIVRHWPWIITPLEAEIEAAPLGGSWYDKEKVSLN